MLAACSTSGCSLRAAHRAAACVHGVAASSTWGCSLRSRGSGLLHMHMHMHMCMHMCFRPLTPLGASVPRCHDPGARRLRCGRRQRRCQRPARRPAGFGCEPSTWKVPPSASLGSARRRHSISLPCPGVMRPSCSRHGAVMGPSWGRHGAVMEPSSGPHGASSPGHLAARCTDTGRASSVTQAVAPSGREVGAWRPAWGRGRQSRGSRLG